MPRITDFLLLQQPKQAIVYIDAVTDLGSIPTVIGENYMRLMQYINELEISMSDVPFVAYNHYEAMEESNIEMKIGFPIEKVVPQKENIKSDILFVSKVVMCMYRGAYRDILSVYDEATQWIRENGYQTLGICYEYYYNDNKYPEEDLLTKVVIPLK